MKITHYPYNAFPVESGNKKIAVDPGKCFLFYSIHKSNPESRMEADHPPPRHPEFKNSHTLTVDQAIRLNEMSITGMKTTHADPHHYLEDNFA